MTRKKILTAALQLLLLASLVWLLLYLLEYPFFLFGADLPHSGLSTLIRGLPAFDALMSLYSDMLPSLISIFIALGNAVCSVLLLRSDTKHRRKCAAYVVFSLSALVVHCKMLWFLFGVHIAG